MKAETQEPTMNDHLAASWQEASRVGMLVWGEATRVGNTLNRIRVAATTSASAPIDDGWEIIDNNDFTNDATDNEIPTDPKSRNEPKMAKSKSYPARRPRGSIARIFESDRQTISEEQLVRNYREVERDLKHAIIMGNAEAEQRHRQELSDRRHKLWEKEQAWTTASTYGSKSALVSADNEHNERNQYNAEPDPNRPESEGEDHEPAPNNGDEYEQITGEIEETDRTTEAEQEKSERQKEEDDQGREREQQEKDEGAPK